MKYLAVLFTWFRKSDGSESDDDSEIKMSTYHYEDGITDHEKPQDLLVKLAEYEPSLPRLDAKSVSQYRNKSYMYDDERYYWSNRHIISNSRLL